MDLIDSKPARGRRLAGEQRQRDRPSWPIVPARYNVGPLVGVGDAAGLGHQARAKLGGELGVVAADIKRFLNLTVSYPIQRRQTPSATAPPKELRIWDVGEHDGQRVSIEQDDRRKTS